MVMLTWCINTHKNIQYLKLAVASIRKNAFYKNAPIIVYTENDVETYEWLRLQPDIEAIYEENLVPKGIGGGANEAIARVKTEYFSLLHSDMWISPYYDKPLLDLVKQNDKPTVACAWRVEPNIWQQPDRVGTTMVPVDTVNGFGLYHHDFQADAFDTFSHEFVRDNDVQYRKVEGVSYVMRKKDWDRIGENDPRYAPSSWEDCDITLRMAYHDYNFVVTTKALVWHFGSRGAIFMDQPNKLIGRSERQIKAEAANAKKWMDKWGEAPQFDAVGCIILTPTLKKRYKELYEQT
jgi:GT2 family glycosyltransferase